MFSCSAKYGPTAGEALKYGAVSISINCFSADIHTLSLRIVEDVNNLLLKRKTT